jgi:hypothetical protein
MYTMVEILLGFVGLCKPPSTICLLRLIDHHGSQSRGDTSMLGKVDQYGCTARVFRSFYSIIVPPLFQIWTEAPLREERV